MLQPISINTPNQMALTYGYDYQGNVTSWTDGTTRTLTYDGMDRLLIENNGTTTKRYFYDTIGNRTAIDSNDDGTLETTYVYSSVRKMMLKDYIDNGVK